MGLLDRVEAALPVPADRRPVQRRYSADTWLSLAEQAGWANGAGGRWLNVTTAAGVVAQPVAHTLTGYMAALRRCPPAFAAQMVRAQVLSQMRFVFRSTRAAGPNRNVFGTGALGVLETPWPRGTTGELVGLMEWHAGAAGNAFVARRPNRLRVLRPDWVGVLYGSDLEPESPEHALDGELLGYVYVNGGWTKANGDGSNVHTLLPSEVAHWSPLPDPENPGRGMSWLTPAVRDMQLDSVAADHKITYFANGATPNLVVKGIPATDAESFKAAVDLMEAKHTGVRNAYRTLYLTAGADATVVGSNLAELDMKNLQGFSETRISFLSRVPAPLLGISEGLAGSALNAGNYGMARRTFGDTWVYPSMQDLCGSLAPIVDVPQLPSPSELWFDGADIPLLREDAKDAAAIAQIQGNTIVALVKDGFTADSATAAVITGNMALLKHTGMVSVQLQLPGSMPPATGGQ